MSTDIHNPVLPGCHPDPSCCRVGDWYYLACSSFHYWPGLPLLRSRDLVHWEPIGHAIDRPGQMDLRHIGASEGLFAPTLRHHDGRFVLVCTRVAGERSSWRNFIIEATDAAGAWSDPIWIEPAPDTDPGIDPSVVWDETGACWLHGNRRRADGGREIWLQRWDERKRHLLDDPIVICRGSCGHGVEGPHLYRIAGRWYLITAEGGTGAQHAVACYRADAITGPYEACPNNPVLTHRHLGAGTPIVNPGHADLIQAPDGSWAALLLASRQCAPGFTPLGRETWLCDVIWEEGWPVFRPGDGRLREQHRVSWTCMTDAGDDPGWAPPRNWHCLRTPATGAIAIDAATVTLVPSSGDALPAHWLTRCTEAAWSCTALLPAAQSPGVACGLLAIHNDHCQLRVVRIIRHGQPCLQAIHVDRSGTRTSDPVPMDWQQRWLCLQAENTRAQALVSSDGAHWQILLPDLSLAHCTPRSAWGFVGTSVGCMAAAPEAAQEALGPVTFEQVDYQDKRIPEALSAPPLR